MKPFGERIRELRKAKKETLNSTALATGMDATLLSRIERGERRATRAQMEQLSTHLGADAREMRIAWLGENIYQELQYEEFAKEAIMVAEARVAYGIFQKSDRTAIVKLIKNFLSLDGRVLRAWMFGSFARGDDGPKSDIDLMIEEDPNGSFSYFDLADIQFKLENLLKRKVDIGFASSLRDHAAQNIRQEAQLIYENT
ncbi:MAG: XRE family transcriptional regulator [Flavobacteriales bacterium]|nr:XRE family transcriptional regulator [Flavobacteriales bacterium]